MPPAARSWPTRALRDAVGAGRAVLGLLLAVTGLLVLPYVTAAVTEVRTNRDALPNAAITGPAWVPSTSSPRTASTSVTVESTRVGVRVAVVHTVEVTEGDLLYAAARGRLVPERDLVEAVFGVVKIQFGDGTYPPEYGHYLLDRARGSLSRITVAHTREYRETDVPTGALRITLTPPEDKRAAASSTTVSIRGVGYAVDRVPSGEPETEQTTGTTFVDPPGPVDLRLFRTATAATKDPRRYGTVRTPWVPPLFPSYYEVSFLAVLVPWLVLFAFVRPRATRGGGATVAAWALIAGVAVASAGLWKWNAAAAVAAPLLLAAWLGASRSWTRRAVHRYLLAVAALTAVGAALMLTALPVTSWFVLLAGCSLGALVTASALALLLGRRPWASVGAVAGAAAVLAYLPANGGTGDVVLVVVAGLLWAPLLAPVWPRTVPGWVRWVVVTAVAGLAFVTARVAYGVLTWHLPDPEPRSPTLWPIMARLALVAVALCLLWKHLGPPPATPAQVSAVAVRRRYRSFVRAAAGQRRPLVRAAGIALATAAFAMPGVAVTNATIAYIAMPLMLLATLRPARDDSPERLARVTSRAFTRMLDARAEGLLAVRILDRLYHTSPAHLASGDLSLDEFNRLKTAAVTDARRGAARARRLPALASAAGLWATRNGVAAALIVAALATPLVVLEAAELLPTEPDQPLVYFVEVARRVGRWTAYGFLFGCLYPSLRGETPTAKALLLGAALAVPEALLALFTSATDTGPGVAGAMGLRAAQVVAVMFLLGLIWEYRLARLARAPWTYIRDLRQVSALAAPVTAVAVAVATALIAVLIPELLGTAQADR